MEQNQPKGSGCWDELGSSVELCGFKALQNNLLALEGLIPRGKPPNDSSKIWVRLLVPHIHNTLSEKGPLRIFDLINY